MSKSRKSRKKKSNKSNRNLNNRNNTTRGLSRIKKRLEKELDTDVRFTNRNNSRKRKISNVLSEMLHPLLENAITLDEKKNIVGIGTMAWNLGLVKKFSGENELQNQLITLRNKIPKEVMEVLIEYIEIKYKNYNEYNELIVEYEYSSMDSKQDNLTVAYRQWGE